MFTYNSKTTSCQRLSHLHTLNFSVNRHWSWGQKQKNQQACLRHGTRQTANYSPWSTGRANSIRTALTCIRDLRNLQQASVNISYNSSNLANVWFSQGLHIGVLFLNCTRIQAWVFARIILFYTAKSTLWSHLAFFLTEKISFFTLPWPQKEPLLPLWQQSEFQQPTVESQQPRQVSFGNDSIGNALSNTDHNLSTNRYTISIA